jgi:LuxR family maltose regulon positive regulatory protein
VPPEAGAIAVTETRDAVLKPLFRRHARRPRLTGLLDDAKAQSILVTAPAGYGKTTLAREWLQGREDIAWYHATPASADVGAFSAGLAEAVAPVVPGAGERVRQRLRVGDATERLARPLAELLAEDLEAWPAGGIVVLDDYHFLAESTPVEDFVDWLLTLVPIRMLVTSRRRPGWATARRFLHGEVIEFGRDQLAMTDEEAGRVLEGRSTEAVRALVRQAEGWPALIGLASLSADLEFPTEKVSESLFRYFAEEVLRREPPEVQRFMLLASVGSSVGPRIGRDVLGFDNPDPILETLRDEDLLHESATGDLRFHPLLREFLRHRLHTDDAVAFAETARLIVNDASAHGRWEEAFELTLESGKVGQAAEIAGAAARNLLAAGQSETLEKWLSACGAAGVTVPGAALARAELLVRKGEMSAAVALALDTARRLPEEHPDHAWASNVAGRALHFTSREEEAFERFEAAKRTAKNAGDVKDALWGLLLAATEIAPGTMSQYLDELESRFADDIDVRFRVAVGRYGAAEQTSSLEGEWQRLSALLDSVQHATDPLAASGLLVVAAVAANFRGHYSEGRALAQKALNFCTELQLDFGLGVCLAYKAVAEIGLRQFADARRTLSRFERSSIHREDPYIRVEGLTINARLLASVGALEDALLTREQLPATHVPPRALGAYLATLSIIHASHGDSENAHKTAREARENGTSIETLYCSLLGDVIADAVTSSPEATVQEISKAVIASGRAQYVDGLVFAYRLYPPLLDAAREHPEALAILRTTLGLARDYELARRAGILISPDVTNDPLGALTRRELEVLGLLSQGMTNAEIGRHLFIAPSTAKVHVRHIMDKLGARNRLQAVLRANELLL